MEKKTIKAYAVSRKKSSGIAEDTIKTQKFEREWNNYKPLYELDVYLVFPNKTRANRWINKWQNSEDFELISVKITPTKE